MHELMRWRLLTAGLWLIKAIFHTAEEPGLLQSCIPAHDVYSKQTSRSPGQAPNIQDTSKIEVTTSEKTFLLKDKSWDIPPPDRFRAMKKANNTFGFPTLALLVLLLLCKTRKEWVYLLLNWYFFPPLENLKNGDHSKQSQAGSCQRFSMALITEGSVVVLQR